MLVPTRAEAGCLFYEYFESVPSSRRFFGGEPERPEDLRLEVYVNELWASQAAQDGQQIRIGTRAHQYSRGPWAPGPQEIRDQARPGSDAIRTSTRAEPMLVVTTSSLRRVATTCGWSLSCTIGDHLMRSNVERLIALAQRWMNYVL